MVNLREISIGNIFSLDGNYGAVFALSCDGFVSFQLDNNDEIVETKVDDLNGVEIDAHLLEELGAAWDDTFLSWVLNIDDITIELSLETSNTDGREWGLSIIDANNETILMADIQYLHQLQNHLFNATGVIL